MAKPHNVILLSMDAVRRDHLGIYGYARANTPNIDKIGREGIVFENATATSSMTPMAHGSMLTGNNPPIHKMRDPFAHLESTLVSEVLKANGYSTAGFVAVGFLSAVHGFNRGFDYYSEPNEESAWDSKVHVSTDGKDEHKNLKGNLWRDEMFEWLRKNKGNRFFIFAHYFEVHWGLEEYMVEQGLIDKDHLPEWYWYDAKIEFMDRFLVGPMVEQLKELDVYDETILILTADHGENLGEVPVPPPFYPQHRTLYECDMNIPLIIKAPGLPAKKRVPGLVRTIDIAPTILGLLKIEGPSTDGGSLLPAIESGRASERVAYAEELYSRRGFGDFQAVKSDTYKYIIDRRSGKEEFYDLLDDPIEKINLIEFLTHEQKQLKDEWKELCDKYLNMKGTQKEFSDAEKAKIEKRLKLLGYKGF
jgi:arylsulfatase A-like enzyme